MTFYKYWDRIPWKKLERIVAKLQRQIFRAKVRGQRRRVRWLQRKLIQSKANILLSIRRVTQKNRGKKTAGIDKIVISTGPERIALFEDLIKTNLKDYNPPPVKRAKIKKKNGKTRPLGIPTIKDRVIQNIIKNALEPEWEALFEPTSYGFRPKRNAWDALDRIHQDLCRGKRRYIFEGDFKGCFDNIDHSFLINRLKDFPYNNLIEKWLKAGCLENGAFQATESGTPQGSIISPLLANIALFGMQETLGITYKQSRRKEKDGSYRYYYSTCGKYRLIFYADDFIIACETLEDAESIPNLLKDYLDERGLTLQEEKTKITEITDGFDFLGFNIRGWEKNQGDKQVFKLIKQPSKTSIKEAKRKIKEIFKRCNGHNVDLLITQLNPVLRGIANYWSRTCAKKVLSDMDNYIWIKTKHFLSRLHPNKSWKWIKKRYFRPDHTGQSKDKWILTDPDDERHQLIKMAWTPIRYHHMIAYRNTPFDSNLVNYFQQRDIQQFMRDSIYLRRILAKKQKFRCPFCDCPITDPNGEYDIHHRNPRATGGTDTLDNFWLVHRHCHIEYHKVFKAQNGPPSTENNFRAFKLILKQKLSGKHYT